MATMELQRDPAVPSLEQQGRRREELSSPLTAEASIFPSVPTHTPMIITSTSRQQHQQGHLTHDEEEMEEVLEELQEDDEIEEMADSTHYFSPDSTRYLIEEQVDTPALLDSAQSICIASIQQLLRAISVKAPAYVSGREDIETMLTKANDSQGKTQLDWLQSIEPLIASLGQASSSTSTTEGDQTEDIKLMTSLRDLVQAIEAAKDKADMLDSRYRSTVGQESVSPVISQASSISPREALSLPFSQQGKSQRGSGLGRQGASSSPLISSSPSTSREELRNPFSDTATRSQSFPTEERPRYKSDRETECLPRLAKTLRGLDKRCSEVVANLEAAIAIETSSQESQEGNEQILKTWLCLQGTAKSVQTSLPARYSSQLGLVVRKGSHSPIAYSPTCSPARGRSRRNSNTSLQSVSTSLSSIEGGDPVGEATAAGVGVGVMRSLSRLSSLSGRTGSSSAVPLLPPSTSYLTGSPHTRRESNKSDGTAPPRYSEDSARKWSESVLGASREAEMSGQQRIRHGSAGNVSVTSSRTLPAYDSTDLAYQRMSTSTSSLNKLDSNTMLSRDEKKSSSSAIEGDLSTPQPPAHSTTSAEYSARTSQDLRMVETSIERLYSAVPQLSDQRASSPTENKRRQSQDVLMLIEQLTKSGRMEDQRAVLPAETSQRTASVAESPETSQDTAISPPSNSAPLSNTRLGRRLGSISFGRSLSIRLASSVLGSDGKGKEKESSREAWDEASATAPSTSLDEILPLAEQVQAASERGFQDQRAQIRAKPVSKTKPSKVGLIGVSDDHTKENTTDTDEVDLFEALAASMSSNRRLENQDAPLRPLSARRVTSPPSSAVARIFPFSATTMSNQNGEENSRGTSPFPSSPIHRTMDGECAAPAVSSLGSNADSSNRDIEYDHGIEITQQPGKELEQLRYISESQSRLGSISAQIWTTLDHLQGDTASLQYQIDQSHSHMLRVNHRGATTSYLLPSNAETSQEMQAAPRSHDHWQIKLQMAASLHRVDSREAPTPFSASMLQKDLPTAFLCNVCMCLIADTQAITQYLPLPSQHWEELIDAWMCHSSQEINQGMIDTQRKLDEHRGLHRGQGRVSDAGIILHASHVALDATCRKETDSPRLRCTHCKSVLGREASSGAIELFKYAIRPRSATQLQLSSMLGLVVANDFIRLSQAHATRHFLLLDEDKKSSTTPLHLWLFLENVEIAVSLPSSFDICGLEEKNNAYSHSTSVSLSACKIMYREGTSKDSTSDSQNNTSAWAQPDLVEHIQYPKEVCLQLRDLLRGSTLCYPPSRRKFAADWTVGFLQTSSSISTS